MEIVYSSEQLLRSFHEALDSVAKEEIFIEMVEAKSFDETAAFQRNLISNHWPSYFAVENGKVVGWIDITPHSNPRLAHRGFLGMGLLDGYRGRGIGTLLVREALEHARDVGLEKIELTVYTDNPGAIRLYEKAGFSRIGVLKHYRKLKNRYFDCAIMELFL